MKFFLLKHLSFVMISQVIPFVQKIFNIIKLLSLKDFIINITRIKNAKCLLKKCLKKEL